MIKIQTNSEDETRDLGRRIGELLQPGTVIALNGSLGTGKTRLTQGIGSGLDIPDETIVSPTYTICVPYSGRLTLIHIDAYRINNPTEVDELGLDELVEDGAVLVIEWAARIRNQLPPIDIEISLVQLDEVGREIKIQSSSPEFLKRLSED